MCRTTEPWRSRSPVCQDCRDQLEREGTCIRCRKHPAIEGNAKRICLDCKGERTAGKRRRDARRAQGLCGFCDTPSETYLCDPCRDRNSANMKRLRERRIAEGVCRTCLKRPAPAGTICDECRKWLRDHFSGRRMQVLVAYGAACSCCGDADVDVLDVDHLNPTWRGAGTGRPYEEAGVALHNRIIEANFPADYRLLCKNCNWSSRLHGGTCRLGHTSAALSYIGTARTGGSARRNAAVRREVLLGYGGKCGSCDESSLDVLDVDHVGGGGSEERRTFKHQQLWARLVRDGFPSSHRVLCRNCNWRDYLLRQRAARDVAPDTSPPVRVA